MGDSGFILGVDDHEAIDHQRRTGAAPVRHLGTGVDRDGAELLTALRQLTTTVYLETSPALHDEMAARYIDQPLLVIWKGAFHQLITALN